MYYNESYSRVLAFLLRTREVSGSNLCSKTDYPHCCFLCFTQTLEANSEKRFQVLTSANMKTAVFWVVVLCSQVEIYRYYRCTCCFKHRPDDGGSTHL
jgi:hypothetical protein